MCLSHISRYTSIHFGFVSLQKRLKFCEMPLAPNLTTNQISLQLFFIYDFLFPCQYYLLEICESKRFPHWASKKVDSFASFKRFSWSSCPIILCCLVIEFLSKILFSKSVIFFKFKNGRTVSLNSLFSTNKILVFIKM